MNDVIVSLVSMFVMAAIAFTVYTIMQMVEENDCKKKMEEHSVKNSQFLQDRYYELQIENLERKLYKKN